MAQPRSPTFDELYRQIEALPQGVTGEIIDPGVLRTMSRPGRAHRLAAQNCHVALSSKDQNVGGTGWWIEQEAEIRFGAVPPFDHAISLGSWWLADSSD